MCDCAKKTIEVLKEKFPKAEEIYIQNQELISQRIFSVVKVKYPNKKKEDTLNLVHGYCPTCGEKYE